MAFISLFCRTGKSTAFYFAKSNILASTSSLVHNPILSLLPTKFKTRFNSMVIRPPYNETSVVDYSFFAVLARIFKFGYEPDAIILNAFIQGLFKGNRIIEAMELYKKLVIKKFCNETTYEIVIDGLCKSGNIRKALELLRYLLDGGSHKPNTVMYNTVIDSLCKDEKERKAFGTIYGGWKEIERLLIEMINAKIYPNAVIFNTILDTVSDLNPREFHMLDGLQSFLTIMSEKNIPSPANAVICNALIEVNCLKFRIEVAVQILQGMRDEGYETSISSYNIILKGYWKMGRRDDAFSFFFKEIIGKGLEPDVVTYNAMIEGLFDLFCCDEATDWIKYMRYQGFGQDISSNCIWIDGLCNCGQISKAYSLLCKMESSGAPPLDISAYNNVIFGLISDEKLSTARDLFNRILWKADDKTYNVMIQGLCQQGLLEDAKVLLKKMQECGFKMELMVYNFMLYGLKRKGDGAGAKLLEKEMESLGFRPSYCMPIPPRKGYRYDDLIYVEESNKEQIYDRDYEYLYGRLIYKVKNKPEGLIKVNRFGFKTTDSEYLNN